MANQRSTPEAVAHIIARIERIPLTGFHLKARMIVGTATFFDAFDALSIAFVLPALIRLWKRSSASRRRAGCWRKSPPSARDPRFMTLRSPYLFESIDHAHRVLNDPE